MNITKSKLLGFAIAVASLGVIGITQLPAQAANIDDSRDCDQWAVIYCGTKSVDEIRKEYDTNGRSNANGSTKHQSDIQKVFSGMGVSRADLNGTFKSGVVYQDGRVVVDGKTVATGSVMAARGLGGSTLSGTNAQRVSVGKMGSAQTAFVKFDANGKFLFAIMKPCGNVVTGTPTKPKPQPKPATACTSLKADKLSRTSYRFTATASAVNGGKINSYTYTVKQGSKVVTTKTTTSRTFDYTQNTPGSYTVDLNVNATPAAKDSANCTKSFVVEKPPVKDITVCELKTKTWIKIKETEFDSSKHSKNPEDCKEAPKPVEVCNPETGETIEVPAEEEDNYVPVGSPACEDIEVCELETKTYPVTIKQAEFDSSKHSTNPADCEETPVTPEQPEAPAELPETGPADVALSVIGLGSVIAGAGYYVASRRSL